MAENVQQIRLSDLQRGNVWEGWLGSEIRAHYFADLCRRYQLTQRVVTWMTLIASSGAAATVVGAVGARWLPGSLALIATMLSLWALVTNYGKHVTDASDLHLQWSQLAIDYESLWADMYSTRAGERLMDLRRREAQLSASATRFPNKKALMLKWERHVIRHRVPAATAA